MRIDNGIHTSKGQRRTPSVPRILTVAVALNVLPFATASAGEDPLTRYLWNHRVVVALASSTSDPNLSAQRRIFETVRAGARERDLALLEATDDTPEGAALRHRFGGGADFRTVLIGKDGGAKASSEQPMQAGDVFATIDAMPMRRAEMMRQTP